MSRPWWEKHRVWWENRESDSEGYLTVEGIEDPKAPRSDTVHTLILR